VFQFSVKALTLREEDDGGGSLFISQKNHSVISILNENYGINIYTDSREANRPVNKVWDQVLLPA
jgi:hypothetical protein